MKRFAAGLVLGLLFGGGATVSAEWWHDDTQGLFNALSAIVSELSGIRSTLERMAPPPTPIPKGTCGPLVGPDGRTTGLRPCR